MIVMTMGACGREGGVHMLYSFTSGFATTHVVVSVRHHIKGVARGGQMGQQPHPGMSLPHQGGAEGAAAPPWHGCKDPKLTKKERKT